MKQTLIAITFLKTSRTNHRCELKAISPSENQNHLRFHPQKPRSTPSILSPPSSPNHITFTLFQPLPPLRRVPRALPPTSGWQVGAALTGSTPDDAQLIRLQMAPSLTARATRVRRRRRSWADSEGFRLRRPKRVGLAPTGEMDGNMWGRGKWTLRTRTGAPF